MGAARGDLSGVATRGHDLAGLDVQAVRRQYGVVLQSGKIMPGSIYLRIFLTV